MVAAEELLAHARGRALIGDTGYDSNAFLKAVVAKGMRPVIHSKPDVRQRPCCRAPFTDGVISSRSSSTT